MITMSLSSRTEWKLLRAEIEKIEDLKAQLEGNLKVAPRSSVKTKVVAPGMYAIDVEPIPPRLKNNRNAHLTYINHLKESVETVREIVEEARVVKPLDNVLNYACQYTKLSQELVEYVIGTCPKEFTERDSKAPSIPLTRKKQVTFTDTCSTSTNNTQKHRVHQKVQQSNVQVIPSTGVSSSTRACGSKPRSNTKNNRILPAKSVNNKKVEDHPRTNKSVWTKVNRVDSGISSKRVVINSNSESVCKTCNKCLNSASHEMCVVNILSSVNATPTVKIVLNKGKQIWKPKGKLSDNSLNKTKQIWKPKGKLSDNSLKKTKQVWKATGKLFANVGYQWRPTGKKFALGELCPLTRLPVTCCSKLDLEESMAPVRISSGPEPKMMFGQNSSSLVLHQMMFAQISSGLAPQCLKMRLLASLQAPFLKEKKGVRFSALYLQQKRNLLVLDHSHQQVSYFFHARSVVKWINVDQLIWKPKSKLSDNSLNKTKQVWKATGKLFVNVGYQWRSKGKKVALGKLNCGYQWRPTGKKFALGELCPLTKLSVQCGTNHPLVSGLRLFKTYDGESFKAQELCGKTMAPVRISSGPEPIMMTPGQLNSGLAPSHVPATTNIPPTDKDLEILFQPMFDEHLEQSRGNEPVPSATKITAHVVQMHRRQLRCLAQSSSGNVNSAEPNQVNYTPDHLRRMQFFEGEKSETNIRKGYLLLDLQKLQKNPIFRISVDIRQNTNFVRAFTTSANVPSIYIQLFWNTLTHDVKTGRWIIASQDETTGPSVHPEDATSTKMVRETLSHADAESGGNSEKINSETDTEILNVGSNSEQSHVALAGPNPEHNSNIVLSLRLITLSYKDGKVRSKCENKGIVPTEMELVLEYTQQGASHEVSVSTEGVEE
ncbi:hypothetical protein Tco_0951673 [Tanacetum coccineum]|uniref:Uncharacterized protein n=1 Tax=Tanacetum coccineum TaxID=301880 RepID=A0ABQ5DXL2_9ASTR